MNCDFCGEVRQESTGIISLTVSVVSYYPCPKSACIAFAEEARIKAVADKLADDIVYRKNATELCCDECQALIGYVNECDLNGSRFYCVACKNKA